MKEKEDDNLFNDDNKSYKDLLKEQQQNEKNINSIDVNNNDFNKYDGPLF